MWQWPTTRETLWRHPNPFSLIRAVHLELANSLTTDFCILALRRLFANRVDPLGDLLWQRHKFPRSESRAAESTWRFRQPAVIVRFCGGGDWVALQFAGSPTHGASMGDIGTVCEGCSCRHFTWAHPQARASLNLLRRGWEHSQLSPLTPVTINCHDAENLTPNHFLIGELNATVSPLIVDGAVLKKSWRVAPALTEKYWSRWVRENLPEVTKHTRWHHGSQNCWKTATLSSFATTSCLLPIGRKASSRRGTMAAMVICASSPWKPPQESTVVPL